MTRAKQAMPTLNVYWRDIPAGARVEDWRRYWVAYTADGPAVPFWEGCEAYQAQTTLAAWAALGYRPLTADAPEKDERHCLHCGRDLDETQDGEQVECRPCRTGEDFNDLPYDNDGGTR